MATDLDFLTIAQAARLIRDSEVSPREVVDHLLRRIQNLDPQLNPFITVTADDARRQARRAEDEIMPARGAGRCTASCRRRDHAGTWCGPMHGIPFGLKDIYDTAGILTSGYPSIDMDRVPSRDATSVRKLYEAGAVLMGKLPRTSSLMADRPSICPGHRPAILGTPPDLPAAQAAAPAWRSAAGFVFGAMPRLSQTDRRDCSRGSMARPMSMT